MRIALDAMGTDLAPEPEVLGALRALEQLAKSRSNQMNRRRRSGPRRAMDWQKLRRTILSDALNASWNSCQDFPENDVWRCRHANRKRRALEQSALETFRSEVSMKQSPNFC